MNDCSDEAARVHHAVRRRGDGRSGLMPRAETGYVEDQNVMVEYHWLDDQYERLPMRLGHTSTADRAANPPGSRWNSAPPKPQGTRAMRFI
jgi:hypothetical protein